MMDFKQAVADEKVELSHFTNQDAFILGSYISRIANENNLPVIINIERNNQTIYHYANDGTSKNNEDWIVRKANVVKHFNHSSAFIALKLKEQGLTFKQKYGDDSNYALTPGAIPIIVSKVGIVAYMGISGLDSDSDHALMMKGIHYLKSLEEGEQ